MSKVRHFFSESEEAKIIQAIQDAEVATSGEIRIHVEKESGGDAYERAIEVFASLEMHKTELRNGVLFYLATDSHQFTILGDEGINKSVPEHFWEEIRDEMQEFFKKKDFVEGLSRGIKKAGVALADYFPYQDDDINELPDEISTSDQ